MKPTSEIATTPEQSRVLMDLGLPITRFDMAWVNTKGIPSPLPLTYCVMEDIKYEVKDLCCSLSELLNAMPNGEFDDVGLFQGTDHPWVCNFSNVDAMTAFSKEGCNTTYGKDPVTAAYEMVKWLLQRGLIEKKD